MRTRTRFRDLNPSGEKSAQIGNFPHLPRTELILSYLDVRSSKGASEPTQENNSSRVEREANADTDTASRPEPVRGKVGADWDLPSLTSHGTDSFLYGQKKCRRFQDDID